MVRDANFRRPLCMKCIMAASWIVLRLAIYANELRISLINTFDELPTSDT